MNITEITIDNFLGARRVRLQLPTPVVLVAGPNGAGKSSINEAVRLALGDSILRMEGLKAHFPLMISDGAKEAEIVIGTSRGTAAYVLPKGEQAFAGELATDNLSAMPYVLNAQAFASMTPEARRTFLFALTKSTASPAKIQSRLLEKKHAIEKIEVVLPMLKSGFPAAAKLAADKVTEARGAWKATTGEAYGSKKAESWEAPTPAVDAEVLAKLRADKATADEKLTSAEQALGAAKAAAADYAQRQRQFDADTTAAALVAGTTDTLAAARAAVTAHEIKIAKLEPLAGDGPKQGLVHDLARFVNGLNLIEQSNFDKAEELLGVYEEQFGPVDANTGDPAAKAQLAEARKALQLARANVATLEGALAKQKAAAERIEAAGGAPVAPSDALASLTAARDAAKALRDTVTNNLAEREHEEKMAATAGARTETAKQHHADALAWAALAEALGPDGIPAEILAQALKPINKALQDAAVETTWKQVRIQPDMTITADGRLYALLCESEKWRCDAMIAEVIAELSDIRILLLDRMDVLDLPGRAQLLMWLDSRAYEGHLSTAIVCGTMKAKPSGLPDTISAYWLADGTLEEIPAEAHAEAA